MEQSAICRKSFQRKISAVTKSDVYLLHQGFIEGRGGVEKGGYPP